MCVSLISICEGLAGSLCVPPHVKFYSVSVCHGRVVFLNQFTSLEPSACTHILIQRFSYNKSSDEVHTENMTTEIYNTLKAKEKQNYSCVPECILHYSLHV